MPSRSLRSRAENTIRIRQADLPFHRIVPATGGRWIKLLDRRPERAVPAMPACPAIHPEGTDCLIRSSTLRLQRRATLLTLVVTLLGMLSVAVDFRYQILDSFRMLFSDNYDGVIEVSLFEHWYQVLRGADAWNVTTWFYPTKDTLGYNDGFLLLGLIDAPIRLLGADPFLAHELANAVARFIGFVCFFLLARQAGRLHMVASCTGAMLFTLWDTLWLHSFHAQLLTIDFEPLILLLGFKAGSAAWNQNPRRTMAYGVAAALLFGSVLLTGFYMSWYFAFFCAITFVLLLLLHPTQVWMIVLRLWTVKLALAVIALSTAIAVMPFLLVYAPKIRETGMHGYAEVAGYLRGPAILVHIGFGNLLFGWLDRLIAGGLPDVGEYTVGVTPLVLLTAAWGMLDLPHRRLHPVYGSVALSCLAFMVLPIRFGSFSFWYWVYRDIPGAAGIRTVPRMVLFLAFPISILCSHGIDRLLALRLPVVAIGLAVLVLAEQVNLEPQNRLDRRQEMRTLSAIPPPPSSCRSFYVIGLPPPADVPSRLFYDLYDANVSAMLVSENLGLPTINGFSTFNPRGWDFAGTYGAGYTSRVGLYGSEHDILSGLCSLDLANRRWDPAPLKSPQQPISAPLGGQDDQVAFGTGWSDAEPHGRWTDAQDAELGVLVGNSSLPATLALELQPFAPGGRASPVILYGNGHILARWSLREGEQTLEADLPASLAPQGYLVLRLHIVTPRSPKSVGVSTDDRALGLFVEHLRIQPRGARMPETQ